MSHRIKEKAIHAWLDGRLDPQAEVELRRHLEGCEACSRYLERVRLVRQTMREIAATSPPPVDWARVDAGLEERLAESRGRRASSWVMWGAMAAVTATAVLLVALLGLSRGGAGPEEPATRIATEQTPAPTDEPSSRATEDEPLDAFVVFVAGEATVTTEEGSRALGLETALRPGARIHTGERGGAGVQLGSTEACRLGPDTEVRLAALDTSRVRLELLSGRVTCSTEGDERSGPRLEVGVTEIVASATSRAHFSVTREPRIVVIELAAGTLRAGAEGEDNLPLDRPERLTFRQDAEGRWTHRIEPASQEHPLTVEALPVSPRRTIASLQLPALDGVTKVRVDGVEYGALPLALRHRPGRTHVELFLAEGEPIVEDVEIGLGPRVVSLELPQMDASGAPTLTPGPRERRVARKIGTFRPEQIRRLRSLVSSSVRSCYERALKRNPSIWGRIRVRFTVSTTGEARRVRVTSLAGGHRDVNRCIEGALGAHRFPPPIGGRVPVEQDITLAPRF